MSTKITAPGGAVHFTAVTDVTVSRVADGTVYQNTSVLPRLVTVQSSGSPIACKVGSANPPTITIITQTFNDTNEAYSFIVPPSWYYNVTKTAGTLGIWSEAQ